MSLGILLIKSTKVELNSQQNRSKENSCFKQGNYLQNFYGLNGMMKKLKAFL